MSAVIHKLDRETLAEVAARVLDNFNGQFSGEDHRRAFDDDFGSPSQASLISQARDWYEKAVESELEKARNKKARLSAINKQGQIDWSAQQEALIKLGDGNFIHFRNADVWAIEIRDQHQQANIDNATHRLRQEREAFKPVLEYMAKHNVRFGEALIQMSLI